MRVIRRCQLTSQAENLFSVIFQMARAVWLYYMAKVIELLDTVFFVLRKKNSQVSFLHLYHHTLMPMCAFVGVKYFAGKFGQCPLNSCTVGLGLGCSTKGQVSSRKLWISLSADSREFLENEYLRFKSMVSSTGKRYKDISNIPNQISGPETQQWCNAQPSLQ